MSTEAVPGLNAALKASWQQKQIELARLVPGGKRLVATKSNHGIPTGQPDLVVRAIRSVLAQLASDKPRRT